MRPRGTAPESLGMTTKKKNRKETADECTHCMFFFDFQAFSLHPSDSLAAVIGGITGKGGYRGRGQVGP